MTRQLSPSPPSFKLFLSKRSSMERSSNKKRIESASVSFGKLQRSFADASATSLTVGAANTPDARLLSATIDANTSTSKEIAAVVVASTMIAMAMTVALPTGRRNATVVTAWLAMGIALATISLENKNPWLAARKTARVSSSRAKCTATREKHGWAECSENPANKRSRQQSARKRTTRTTSAALRATPRASATIVRCRRVTSPATSTTTVARTTPTTKITLLLPFRPRLASEPSARYYLPKRSLPSRCLSWTMAPTMTRHWPNLVSWRHCTPQLHRWGRNAAVSKGPKGAQSDPLSLSDSN
jgi:hypothetical protein